jgi:hypothetical protein
MWQLATSHTASGWDATRLSGRRGRPPARKETSSVIARHSVYNSFRVEETEIEM